jgi:cytochrome c553
LKRLSLAAAVLIGTAAVAAPTKDTISLCESCHGKGGNSDVALTPSIAGQPDIFITNQLILFREGLRSSDVMQGVAKAMKDKDAIELGKHFAKSPVKIVSPGVVDPKLETRARQLVGERHCGQCHLPNFAGRSQIPRLAGQREDYLVSTMRAYVGGKRTSADTTMQEVLAGLADADIQALGHFLARRK